MTKNQSRAKASLITSMLIFGTIGIFRQYIPYPSSVIAFVRGFVGTIFLAFVLLLRKRKLGLEEIKKNAPALFISGALIGFNWILLFEAYRYTTVATATLCYYMAPVFIILLSPLLFKEKLTPRRAICAAASFVGMVIISDVFTVGFSGIKGILLALAAAVMYAAVVLINKFISKLDAFDRTIVQLAAASVILLPYMLLTENIAALEVSTGIIILLLIVGVIHTGLTYTLYFGSIAFVRAQTAAIFSYIDPVFAIILSALILKETLTPLSLIGAILILGAALISELPEKKKVF